MKRNSLFLAMFLAATIALVAPAEAQRRRAPVVQGVTSAELAQTANDLRAANAALGARLTGLEADRANLSGKVETLEFLLSQSRDQINDMQGDDAQIGTLIERLERRLAAQDRKIKALESRLDAVEPSAQQSLSNLTSDPGANIGTVTVTSSRLGETRSTGTVTGSSVTNGPTRIVRRTTTPQAANGSSDTVVVTSSRSAQPQGSLGTISASALPGEAGPLFGLAKTRLLQFDYAGAEAAFRSFLSQFGDDPQAGEAQYWLAEVLYQQEAYAESGQAYTQMIRQYPDDPRAPEALAKLARSMRLVGDTEKACNALSILPQRYPDASGVTKNLAAGERVRSGCDA